jgi:hypothetical protein
VQPEEVLELIGSAPERYDTVRAALRYRGDGPTKRGIRERIVWRAFQVSPREAYKPIRHLEPDGPFGWRCRAWHADQYHWRMETEVPGGGVEYGAGGGLRRRGGAPQALASRKPQAQLRSAQGRSMPGQIGRSGRGLLQQENGGGQVPKTLLSVHIGTSQSGRSFGIRWRGCETGIGTRRLHPLFKRIRDDGG